MEIRLAGLEPESIVDGPGYRFTVFVQGCPHNCPGCHNPQTHDFGGGGNPALRAAGMVNLIKRGITALTLFSDGN